MVRRNRGTIARMGNTFVANTVISSDNHTEKPRTTNMPTMGPYNSWNNLLGLASLPCAVVRWSDVDDVGKLPPRVGLSPVIRMGSLRYKYIVEDQGLLHG